MHKRRLRAVALAAAVAAVAASLVTATPPPADAATPPSYSCEPGFYQVLSRTMNRLDFATGSYTQIGPEHTAAYNAIGYNTEDDLIYGVSRDGSRAILRIYGDGTIVNLGEPTPALPAEYFGGDFDDQGNLYVVSTGGQWNKIDVSAMTQTSVTFSSAPAMPDISIIGSVIYGISPGSNTLVRINLADGVVTQVNVSGLPSDTYGASFVSSSTRFFVSNNTTGMLYEISGYAGSSPSATEFVQATQTSSNDGAACPTAGSPGSYSISFSLGGGSGTTPSDIIDVDEGDASALPDDTGFSRTGYEFGGWDCDSDPGTPVAGGGSLTQPAADVACTAIWTPKTPPFTLAFDLGGGTGTTPTTITGLTSGDSSTLPGGSGFSRAGFDFVGWDCNHAIGDVAAGGSLTQPNDDVLCTAVWTPSSGSYSISFSLGGGSGTTPSDIIDVDEGDASALPDDTGFSRTGYEFGGWDCDSDPGTPVAGGGSLTQPAADVACTAIWTPKTPPFTLAFDLGGGTGTTPTTITGLTSGDSSTLPGGSGFSRAGFDFVGWDCNHAIGDVAAGGSLTQPNDDVLCTAVWTPSSGSPTTDPAFSIAFNLGGGSGATPTTITGLQAGDVSTLPDDTGFSRAGHRFDGWACDNSIGHVVGGGQVTQPAADLLCTAEWNSLSPTRIPAGNGGPPNLLVALVGVLMLAGAIIIGWFRMGARVS